jgi:hypothetical protein
MSNVRLLRQVLVAANQPVAPGTSLEVVNHLTGAPVAIYNAQNGSLVSSIGRTVAGANGFIDVWASDGYPYLVKAYLTDYASIVIAQAADPAFVGLDKVNNTADADKPISTAQAAVNAQKISKGTFTAKGQLLGASAAGTPIVINPGTEGQFLISDPNVEGGLAFSTPNLSFFGLDNVDNTRDEDKPVSNPQAAALSAKISRSMYSGGKGVFLVGYANGAPYPFAAGSEGYVLVSDSNVDAGLRWAPLDSLLGGPQFDPAVAIEIHNADHASHPYLLEQIANIYSILNYVAPGISSYLINGSSSITIEKGASLTDPVLTWTLSGNTPESQTIDQGVGDITVGTLTKTVTGTFTTSISWGLSVVDTPPSGSPVTASASAPLNVRQKRYWGVSASTSLDNAGVLGLSNEFASSRGKSVTFDATGGRYVFYAYPASFGLPNVTVNGLSFSDWTKTDLSFTNASGFTEAYYVIRFNNLQNGAAIAVVFA